MTHTELLNPRNSAPILMDFRPLMTFGIADIDRQTLLNNVVHPAGAAEKATGRKILIREVTP